MNAPNPSYSGSSSGSPQPYPYPPGRPGPQIWVPEEAGEGRLVLAAMTDGCFGLLAAFAVAVRVLGYSAGDLAFAPVFLASALMFSFANHVFGTLLFRGSLAKLLFGMRVVRAKDGKRPGFWRTVARWLAGFVLLAVQVMLEEGGGVGQACGLRTVRRRDERRSGR
ncbi:RDD family protein [Nocardia pneumoniae]|uniref:RDD family protein n=1 Tax=Nocardia pneumoniae TaxID=228601 RepID=UPI001C3F1FAA|nr:RDD family protein [Nocardia pneumoniae]